jgi:hypothetical protein
MVERNRLDGVVQGSEVCGAALARCTGQVRGRSSLLPVDPERVPERSLKY